MQSRTARRMPAQALMAATAAAAAQAATRKRARHAVRVSPLPGIVACQSVNVSNGAPAGLYCLCWFANREFIPTENILLRGIQSSCACRPR